MERSVPGNRPNPTAPGVANAPRFGCDSGALNDMALDGHQTTPRPRTSELSPIYLESSAPADDPVDVLDRLALVRSH